MPRRPGRAQKVGDQIQRELSEILRRELRDPRVGMVTLTGVEMSPDFAHATVYFTCLDAAHAGAAAEGLARASGFLRTRLAHRMKLHATPRLRFAYDESLERGDRLSRLIDSVRTGRG
jgi:ribosome-binding factor A